MNKTTKLSILGIAISASFGANAGKTFEETTNSTKPSAQSAQQRLDNSNRTELETPIPKPRSIRYKKQRVIEPIDPTEPPPSYTENNDNTPSYTEDNDTPPHILYNENDDNSVFDEPSIPDATYIEEVRKQRRIQLETEIAKIKPFEDWESIDLYSYLSLENWLKAKKKYAYAGELKTAMKKMKQAYSSDDADYLPVWAYKNIKVYQSSTNPAEFLAKIRLQRVTVEMLINVYEFRESEMKIYDHKRNDYSPFFHVTTHFDERVTDAIEYESVPVKSYKFQDNELTFLENGGVAKFNYFKHFFLTSISDRQTIHYGIMNNKKGLPATLPQHVDLSKENPFLLAFTKIFELAPNKDIESRIIKSFYLDGLKGWDGKLAKKVERTANEHMEDLVADHKVFIEGLTRKVNPYYINDCLDAKDQLIRMLEFKYNVIGEADDLDYQARLKISIKGQLSAKEFLTIEKERQRNRQELNQAHKMIREAEDVYDKVRNARAYELYKKEEEE